MQSAQSKQTDSDARCRWISSLLVAPMVSAIACFTISDTAQGAGLVRVKDETSTYEGQVIALSRTTCSLMDRQGKLVQLKVDTLRQFEKIAPRFEPYATSELRDQLRQEFAGSYEVSGTTHYLVCGPSGKATRYAQLFENIYRDVEQFYRVRGFRIQSPDVPLIAIVFGSHQEFAQYCRRDQVSYAPGLMGYYSLVSNRVALFDDPSLLSLNKRSALEYIVKSDDTMVASAGISGNTTATIVHETIHQVGYNIGVHSRVGGAPAWIVEGLATVLEPHEMRSSKGRQLISNRINSERKDWFERQHRPSRNPGNLAKIVASDDHFYRQTLNSYSEAWALTFFLLENPSRCRNFVGYLQAIAERDVNKPYSAKQRLQDFQDAFGDIGRLETEFVRYVDRL